jgi:hypothetical protein
MRSTTAPSSPDFGGSADASAVFADALTFLHPGTIYIQLLIEYVADGRHEDGTQSASCKGTFNGALMGCWQRSSDGDAILVGEVHAGDKVPISLTLSASDSTGGYRFSGAQVRWDVVNILNTASFFVSSPDGATWVSDSGHDYSPVSSAAGAPEPASATLGTLGVFGLALARWRKRKYL